MALWEDEMDITPPRQFLPLAGDLAIQARVLEVQCQRLIQRQIEFAAYCRKQAVDAKQPT
jgi:hypothetical protein